MFFGYVGLMLEVIWDIQVFRSDGSLLTEIWLKRAGYRPIFGQYKYLYIPILRICLLFLLTAPLIPLL